MPRTQYVLRCQQILRCLQKTQVKKAHGKTLTKMREGFETNLAELRARCDARLASLEDDLELRRKVQLAILFALFSRYVPSWQLSPPLWER